MKRLMTALAVAVVLAGVAVKASGPTPNVPVGYCEYAWWVIECWFV